MSTQRKNLNRLNDAQFKQVVGLNDLITILTTAEL